MDKSPDAFRTISEVADWLNTPAHVLRFWESRFSQVKPVKRAGGRRYYRPSDMVLLGGIKKLLHDDGMTIRGVQKLLREHGVRYVASMSPQIDGIEFAVANSESIAPTSPIPAAPMAEDVPTGAFDVPALEPEEKIVPFARPELAPQPQSDADHLSAQNTTDAMSHTDIEDLPEAPMVDTDAPFEPEMQPAELSDPTPLETPSFDELNLDALPTDPPAQVPFDFNLDADPQITPPSDEHVAEHIDSGPMGVDDTFDANISLADDTVFAAQDIAPQHENIFESDAQVDEAEDASFDAPDFIDVENTGPAPDDIVQAYDAPETITDDVEHADLSALDTAPVQTQTPHVIVPDDPEDDAFGLDVSAGVLGQLNKQALLAADPNVMQAIFERASALHAKLAQTS